ncbi:MAG: HAMP domain-containing histidine kinase, partial [Bacteroidales bacterium]|nr:HAMP domain-containing histidine kinase [Bacteroidales bacterium]
MKPRKPGSRRRNIILYYTLAVVLPGIVLGYMAYRGMRNDQALREKESRQKLEVNSRAFFAAIDSGFVSLINEIADDSLHSCAGTVDPSVLAYFIIDSTGSKKLLNHQLLYLPVEFMSAGTSVPGLSAGPGVSDLPASFVEGQRLEFAEQRYEDALHFYRERVLKTNDPEEKVQALVASARMYNKMKQLSKAKSLYEKIWNDYRGSLLNGQIPLALIAGLEILKINQSLGEKDEMTDNARQCLELMLHPCCEYDRNQFEMFYQSFQDLIHESDTVTDSLLMALDTRKARTGYLIRLLSEPNLTGNSENGLSVTPVNSDELEAVYLMWHKNNWAPAGMVIDFPVYLRSIARTLIAKMDPDSVLNVKILDRNNNSVLSRVISEETVYLSFTFPENLPQWKLLISENKPGFMTTLTKAGSGIYLFVFILIALLMALGFVFTLYTLNVEIRLNKLKSEFISNVSHELKSPLTTIRMMTEMLHHKRVETEERKSAYYSAMLEESEHLSHLIDNILDFSRIEEDRKKYDFVDVDLDELLRKFLESTRESLAEPGFKIRYDHPDHVVAIRADKNAILQVFYNLIDNAIKFSGDSRQIDISISTEGEEVLFSVKDYGVGISAREKEKIFERFYRGDETQKRGIKGSGIGLTIVRKIVEAHNGTID